MLHWSQNIQVSPDAKWLPASVREQIESGVPVTHDIVLSKAEKKVLRKHKRIPVSQWAEKHRILTMSSLPGPWRNSVTPYLAGIMDAAAYPCVRTVVICAGPQSGKSEAVHNFIGYVIDRAPGPVLYVYPDELTGRENSRDRILPMIESSPRLRGYMSGQQDDSGMLRINLMHMPVYIAWARSAARLANKPIRYIVFDETDKYPTTAGPKESDPISLGEARKITYSHNYKIFKISTPTIEVNFIWQALTVEAEVIFDLWVKCPACGRHQLMKFDNIRVPEGMRDVHKIEREKLAYYQCAHCEAKWSDVDRDAAVLGGQWRERVPKDAVRTVGLELVTYLEMRRPAKIGFHIPSWISSFVSLSKTMADWFSAMKDRTKMKDFKNKHMAEPWKEYTNEKTEDAILALRDDRPMGLVPAGNVVAGLIGSADTQDDGFFYEIRAWGYGLIQDSWQIRGGFVTSLEALKQILWEDEYYDADGNQYTVKGVLIDAMGHRTAAVYDFCRMHPGRIMATKGERTMTKPHAESRIDYYPGTNKPIPGGLTLLRFDTNHYKNQLAAMLEIPFADPGSWKFHAKTTVDWAIQMTAEYVAEDGFWKEKSGRANHAWDVSVLNLCAADKLGVRFWPKPQFIEVNHPRSRKVSAPGGWIDNQSGNWINR